MPIFLAGGANLKTEQEERNKQGVDIYINYIKAFGALWIGMFILLLFVVRWLPWVVGPLAERDVDDQQNTKLAASVVAMSAAVILLAMVRAFLTLETTVKASQPLHDDMSVAGLRAKIEFFDTNPMGRILNRFSADIGLLTINYHKRSWKLWSRCLLPSEQFVTMMTTLPFALVALLFPFGTFAEFDILL